MSRSCRLRAATSSSSLSAARAGSSAPIWRYSSSVRSISVVLPDRSATLKRDGASSGNTRVRSSSASSGSSRRVSRSTKNSTTVEQRAIAARRDIATGQVLANGTTLDNTTATAIEAPNGTVQTSTLMARRNPRSPDPSVGPCRPPPGLPRLIIGGKTPNLDEPGWPHLTRDAIPSRCAALVARSLQVLPNYVIGRGRVVRAVS